MGSVPDRGYLRAIEATYLDSLLEEPEDSELDDREVEAEWAYRHAEYEDLTR